MNESRGCSLKIYPTKTISLKSIKQKKGASSFYFFFLFSSPSVRSPQPSAHKNSIECGLSGFLQPSARALSTLIQLLSNRSDCWSLQLHGAFDCWPSYRWPWCLWSRPYLVATTTTTVCLASAFSGCPGRSRPPTVPVRCMELSPLLWPLHLAADDSDDASENWRRRRRSLAMAANYALYS